MSYLDRISSEADKLGGKPCIRGHRIPAQQVLAMLGSGMSEAEIIEDFPQLEHEDFLAVYQWAEAELSRRQAG